MSSTTYQILRSFGVRYILIHVLDPRDWEWWKQATSGSLYHPVGCFDPPKAPSPWPYPICVLEIPTAGPAQPAWIYESGWSGREPWGIWAEGTSSSILWITWERQSRILELEAFPYCLPDRQQTIRVLLNERLIAEERWEHCGPKVLRVKLPESWIRRGINRVVFRYDYAIQPAIATHGQNPDLRWLSVGFTRLDLHHAP